MIKVNDVYIDDKLCINNNHNCEHRVYDKSYTFKYKSCDWIFKKFRENNQEIPLHFKHCSKNMYIYKVNDL